MLFKKVHSGFWKRYDKYFHLLGQYWTKKEPFRILLKLHHEMESYIAVYCFVE